jgi:hypothetical protein
MLASCVFSSQITAFTPLLDTLTYLDLAGAVITADALCRYRHKASYGEVLVMPTCCPGLLVGGVFRAARSA